MAGSTALLKPIAPAKRSLSLDVLRGFAVLGILVMNIQSYALPSSAYLNPLSFEGERFNDYNLWVWLVSHVFADGKFISIFSMLFGAGIIMLSNKAKKEHLRSSDLQSRRFVWLLLIGLAHAYLLWYGDILVAYAICGFIIFVFRGRKTTALFRLGILFLAIGSMISLVLGYSVPMWEAGEFEQLKSEIWMPDNATIEEEIDYYRSNWERQMIARAPTAFKLQTIVFVSETFWRVSGLMLLGMAFYKRRAFTAKQTKKYYRKMVVYGIGVGLPLVVIGLMLNFNYEWDFRMSYYYISQLNYWGSVSMAIGYVGIVMLLMKMSQKSWIANRLSKVGKMALTNYLMQSFICITIFYGHGFGLFADLDRTMLTLIVMAIWVFQFAFSHVWLQYFRQGPMEWVWRSLTYGRRQPLIK